MFRRIRTWLTVALLVGLSAFTRPQSGDLIELQGFLNARSSAQFRDQDANRLFTLPAGTRAQVEEVKSFASGNFGMKIKVVSAPGVRAQTPSVWVYYNVKNPTMKLYSVQGNADQIRETLNLWQNHPVAPATVAPVQANAAVLTQATPAILQRGASAPPAVNHDFTGTSALPENPAEVIGRIQGMNELVQRPNNPTPICRECSERPIQYAECTPQNSYLEQQMDRLDHNSTTRELLNTEPRYSRLEACVRESMTMSGGAFANCPMGASHEMGRVPRACLSSRLVKMVDNGFSMSIDCLAGYLNGHDGDQEMLKQTVRNALALVNLESGFHVNAISSTGAAGLGQITNGATHGLNQSEWTPIQNYINQSSNPSCQSLKRMNLQPATANAAHVCERMSLQNGNPATNMLYTIGHMKSVRRSVERSLDLGLRENGIRLSLEKHEALIEALTNWGHNTGAYGISVPLESLLDTSAGQKALQEGNIDEFLNLLKAQVSGFTVAYARRNGQDENSAQARAREASQFYSYVTNKMNLLERKVGRTCTL